MSKALPQWLDREEIERLPVAHRDAFVAWLIATGYASRSPFDPPGSWCGRVDVTALLHWLADHPESPGDDSAGVEFDGLEWFATRPCFAGGVAISSGPTPVATLWAAVLHVLGVEV